MEILGLNQKSLSFILLKNVKMPTIVGILTLIVGILTFIRRINFDLS